MSPEAGLAQVRAAAEQLEASRLALTEAVRRARAAGATWAEIGDLLGITRQAAYKRFATPTDPRTGDLMHARTHAHTADLTTSAFELLNAGDIDALHAMMTPDTARELTAELLTDIWARVVGEMGPLVACTDHGLADLDQSPIDPTEPVLGSVVGYCTLECEAGELTGRVAFDDRDRVIGMLALPTGVTGPF